MLRTITLALLAVILAVLAFAATRPDSFRIERSVSIQAPPEKVFALIDDFHQWEAWSPWEKIDPQVRRSYSGAARGPGAVYAWQGNQDIGAGRMEITQAEPARRLLLKLDFLKPFEAHNSVEFLLQPEGGGTKVTQAMFGPSPFLSKLMGLVFDMDTMVGGKYEQGLASLKALAER